MESILVVGGAGYIGAHVVKEFLTSGYQVTVFDNLSSGQQINLFSEAGFVYGDIQDRLTLKQLFSSDFDAVVHLAALKAAGESMEVPERYSYQNINGTINLLEAVSNSKTRMIIFSSTAAVYGMPKYLPLDENHPVEPVNYYGFTKQAVEQFLGWYDRLKSIKFASLRYFNAAGYDSEGSVKGLEKKPANLIPIVMETALGIRNSMDVFGNDYPTPDGTGIRDYVHVSDLANGHLKAYEYLKENGKSLTLNLGTGKGHSVLEVIKMTESVTQKQVNYQHSARRAGDPAEIYAKSGKAYDILKWTPRFSDLKTLIRSTWDIYKHYP